MMFSNTVLFPSPGLTLSLLTTLFLGFSLRAQTVIEPPVVGSAISENLGIQKLEITPTQTVVHLELVCLDDDKIEVSEQDNGWFLETDKGERLPLKELRDADYGTITCGEMPLRYFAMVFGPIPTGTGALLMRERNKTWFSDILPETFESVQAKAEKGSLLHEKVLGIYYEKQYDYDNAQKFYQKYVEQLRAQGQTKSTDYLSGMNRLIRLQINKGDFENAKKLSEQTITEVGESNPGIAAILFTLGDIYQLLNDHAQAISSYLKFAQLKRENNTLRHSDLFQLHNMILYSFGSLSEPSKPIAVGAIWLEQPQLDQESRLQVFAVGASQMMFSEGAAFTGAQWVPYEMYTNRLAPEAGKRLFVQFKDGQGRISDVVECMPTEK